ncbi:Predicted PurR-regulated permease PerM [Flavobacteriaceae bacterium MAR_2010_188]|nr:Predicted PurR-regulated permease PerM [Flavobacteriaceae bacterium MAR_2010_188]
MNYHKITRGLLQTIAVIVGIILFFYFIYEIKSLVLYIFIAAIVSLIGRPVVLALKKYLKFGDTAAAITTLSLLILFICAILWIFVPIIIDQSKSITEIDIRSIKRDLNEINIQASEYLGFEQINFIEAMKQSDYVRNFNRKELPNIFDLLINNVGNYIVGLFSVLFIAFFLLKDKRIIISSVTALAEPGKERRFLMVLDKVKNLLSRYFIGLLLQIAVLAILYSGLMLYIDVNNPIAIAFICAFLNIIPYLGPLIAGAIMVLVVVSNNLGADFSDQLLPLIITVLIGHALAQLIDNFISQPFIFGASVRSHPLEIFLVILIAGYIFGIAGMILAIPAYTTIKVIAKEFLSEYKIVKRLTRDI